MYIEWIKKRKPKQQTADLHQNTGKRTVYERRASEVRFPSDGLYKIKENAQNVHLDLQRTTAQVWRVIASLAGKFQVQYETSQIHSVFVVASSGDTYSCSTNIRLQMSPWDRNESDLSQGNEQTMLLVHHVQSTVPETRKMNISWSAIRHEP